MWRIDTDERQARYDTAIRAIQGASWARDVLYREPDDVDLTKVDYLVALVDGYKK